MQNLDLLVSIRDKSCLSISAVQADGFRQVICSCPNINSSQIGILLKDAPAMELSLRRARPEVVCGITIEDYPRGFPVCNIQEVVDDFICLENSLFVTWLSAVVHIKDFLLLGHQVTFHDERQQCTRELDIAE
jgi:hypothetical protein